VPVVPGAQVARPRNLRHPVVHDHAPGDAAVRHGTQPVVRTEPGVQRRVHGRFRAAVGQRGAVCVRQDRAVADQRPDDVPRTETVRRGPAPTVVGVHQHAFHHRIATTVSGQHDTDRRHPPATSRSVAIREYLPIYKLMLYISFVNAMCICYKSCDANETIRDILQYRMCKKFDEIETLFRVWYIL